MAIFYPFHVRCKFFVRHRRIAPRLMSSSCPDAASVVPSPPPYPSDIFPLHILGGGSIGLLYASALQRAFIENAYRNDLLYSPVTLLMRSHHKSRLKRCRYGDGLLAPVTVYRAPKESETETDTDVMPCCDVPVELIMPSNDTVQSNVSPINCVLLCTKATDAVAAIDSILDRLTLGSAPSPSKIIILSNGALAIKDSIQNLFYDKVTNDGTNRQVEIILATTTHGVYRSEQQGDIGYCITHAGEGSTHCTNKEFIDICKSVKWNSVLLSELDINVILWRKLAVNCIINPLTAIHGVKNGQLISLQQKDDIRRIISGVLEEVSRVAMTEMESLYSVVYSEKVINDDEWLQSTRNELTVSSLGSYVNKVMKDTARNTSSMLQDVKAKRVTEVQFLNGHVARIGSKYGIHCKNNLELCARIERLSKVMS
eukprot:g12530.t1 g12530   contig6:2100940-2102220(+)